MSIGHIVLNYNQAGDQKMRLRIRDMREDNDLTQRQIADYLMCDQSLYSKYERGERDVPLFVIVKLAQLYNTSTDYLVGLTDEKKPYQRSDLFSDYSTEVQATKH